jgi:hypothetical protein
MLFVPSTLVSVHADDPPVGLVDVVTLPWLSTATHRVVVGHDTTRLS